MDYRSIPTTLGRAKLEQAALLQVPLQLAVVEFGDGGGAEYEPTGLEVALRGKVYEAAPNMLFNAQEAETWVELHAVIPFDVGGWYLREYGVRDAAGDLIFIGNLPQSFKPIGSSGAVKDIAFELLFDIQNADSVTLKVDPSKVLATRKYVEDYVAQELGKLDHKQSARYTTTAPIGLAGLAVQAGGDWAAALTTGDRVLVKNQAAGKDNGIYAAAAGAWLRVADADGSPEVTSGLVVAVEQGATLADTRWQLVTDGAIVLGTTPLVFQNVSAGYVPLSRIQSSPTDITDGALMAIGALGWGGNAVAVANVDAVTVSGNYIIVAGTLGTKPTGAAGTGTMLHLERGSSNSALQIYDALVGAGSAQSLWSRTRRGDGVWSGWGRVWTSEIFTPGSFSFSTSKAGNYALTVADVGSEIVAASYATPLTYTLPALSTVQSGACFTVVNLSGQKITLAPTGADKFIGAIDRSGTATSYTIENGDTFTVTKYQATLWLVSSVGGTMPALLATNGYEKRPNGLIEQWGSFAVPASSSGVVSAGAAWEFTLPTTFPGGHFQVVASFANGNAGATGADISGNKIYLKNSHTAVQIVRWMAKGN